MKSELIDRQVGGRVSSWRPQLLLSLIVVPHIGIVMGVSGGNNMFAIDAVSVQKQH